ncbi:sn-glycerol-3-phosphate ABC transporter substrate-binding protein UgpB [Roseinatronobacter sp. NSM]|uniref:sn-glycerol-3-phosphate ABC transporter substrate-binding protein UgpB n=1 Tax=Roseinatronobacter sp. NSM TaxID=3457785 RepID=UPI00403753EC
MKKHVFGACIAASTALTPVWANAQVTIDWWHAMGGELGEMLEAIAADFNAGQDEFEVRPSFRGTYTETMTGAIAAFRAQQQPHIVQVFEVGTGTMMAAEGAIYPIYQLMADYDVPFDPSAYLPTVVGYYTDPDGNMLSFPFNSSTPIMYYNKDVFEAAGLDPEQPPRTWAEMESTSIAILESGAAPCGFTTSWPSWVMLENFSAWHNIPLGTQENGFAGFDTEFVFNNDLVATHWDNLKAWQDAGAFRWGGPNTGPDAFPAFYSGECAMVFGSSASRAGVLRNTDFNVGYSFQPYYDTVEGAPQNTIIGGATLWVLRGKDQAEYEGVARFFEYLSQPEVQAQWHQDTGYLPITQAAFDLTREQGYYDENPGSDTSILQMTLNPPTENSKGLRFGSFVQIRDIISEEMESVMTGAKTGQQAADDAVSRGNTLLREFEAAMN